MDLYATIQQLKSEKQKIERAISQLEELQTRGGPASFEVPLRTRPGRKSMGPEERQQVAVRMKRYWASRRQLAPSEGPVGV